MSPNKVVENKMTPQDKDQISRHISVQAKEKAFETAIVLAQAHVVALIAADRIVNNQQAVAAFNESVASLEVIIEKSLNDNSQLRLNATFEVPQGAK